MAEQAKPPRRFFSGIGRMVGISVVPDQPPVTQNVMTAQTVDRNAPTLGVVETTVMPDGSNSVQNNAPVGTMMGAVEVPPKTVLPEKMQAAQIVTAAVEEPVIVSAEKPTEDIIQAPAPVIPEEPITLTILEAPAEPATEVLQPAPEELPEPSVSSAELTGVEAEPIESKAEEQAPEIHVAEPDAVEPEVQANTASEQEEPSDSEQDNGEEQKVKIDPIATRVFIKKGASLIKDRAVDKEAFKEAYEAEEQAELVGNVAAQFKLLGVDPKAIDAHLAEWLEERLAA